MFLLPSLFTVGNIAAGYFSITQTIAAIGGIGDARQHLDWAAIAILIAIPLDSLDGRIARMTNTCSDFGKELDSLADAITFGMAPSLLALIWGFHFLPTSINPQLRQNLLHAGAFICFLFLIGGSRGWRGSTSATTRSRATRGGRAQVLCGHADSGGGRAAGGQRSPLLRLSEPGLVGRHRLAGRGGHERLSHGQHVEILVRQGDQLSRRHPSRSSFRSRFCFL